MTDEQKEDLQFWFYHKVFAEKKSLDYALETSAREVGVATEQAFQYLQADGRLEGTLANWKLIEYTTDASNPQGIYVDIEWMLQLLHRSGLREERLWQALATIYKVSPQIARQEIQHIPIAEGEDE